MATTSVVCGESYALLDVDGMTRNWTTDYDGNSVAMVCRADPMRRLAESLNRALGRYPAPRMMMGWPSKSATTTGADINGSAPFINWAAPDYTRNARTGTVRILSALRSDNQASNGWLTMAHNGLENTGNLSAISSNAPDSTNYYGEIILQQISTSRGAETNSIAEYGINTYGGYQVLDIVQQEAEHASIVADSSVWDYALPGQATGGRDVLADLAEQMRASFHRLRVAAKPFQTSWVGYAQQNAWQYPASTDERAVVVSSNVPVNLINQSWTVRNSDSPGIECKAQYSGRGHTGVASGTVVPCTVQIFCEYNAAGPPGNAGVNIVGPVDYAEVPIIANVGSATGLTRYAANVALNTIFDARNVTNGVNKIDLFGWVANTGTDRLYVRGIYSFNEYN